MYDIPKTFEISASHRLKLNDESRCERLHGHNEQVTVYCKMPELDAGSRADDFGRSL